MCRSSSSRCRPTIRKSGVLTSSVRRTYSSGSPKWVSTKGSVAPSSTSGKSWPDAGPGLPVAHLQVRPPRHRSPLRGVMADAVVAPAVATPSSVLPNLDRIIRGLLYVYIFSLPFRRLLFIERNGFIILIVLLVLWCVVNRRHFFLRTPIDLPLLTFIAWVGFTVPFATFPPYGSKEFATLLQQGLIFYVVVFFFRHPVHRWRLVWMLIRMLPIRSLYGIWQFL